MPYRSRATRWDLLLQPYMAGLQTKARAGAQRRQNVHNSLAALAGVITRSKDRSQQESQFQRTLTQRKDIADRELAIRQGHLDVRNAQLLEEKLDRQAADDQIMDAMENLGLVAEQHVKQGMKPPADVMNAMNELYNRGNNKAMIDLRVSQRNQPMAEPKPKGPG